MNTHETYVSLEVAKLLREAGFDWECPNMYLFTVRGHEIHGMYKGWMPSPKDYWCPTLAIADKWLREKLNTHIEVMFSNTGHNYFLRYCDVTVHGIGDGHWHRIGSNDGYKTYEEALEVGIKKTLEIILEKGE